MLDSFANSNPVETFTLSFVLSVVVVSIAFVVCKSRWGTLENLIRWYLLLAGGVLIVAILVCSVNAVPLVPGFYLCLRGHAPGLTLLAAHTLILILYIDNRHSQKISLSVRTNLLARAFILLVAFLYVLPEYHLLFPAIAAITIPLVLVIRKDSQLNNAK